MKKLLECDLSFVGLLASMNLTLDGVVNLFGSLEPVLHSLLSVGQIAVATATTYYIIRRTRQLMRKDDSGKDKSEG